MTDIQYTYYIIHILNVYYLQYNCEELGATGGGGEYDTQIGFGWSNGVLFELLQKYGQNLNLILDSTD